MIASAADSRMGHIRSFQAGSHSAVSQRILNELAAARLCLLNPERKAQYDAALRAALVPPAAGGAADGAPPVPVAVPLGPIPLSTPEEASGQGVPLPGPTARAIRPAPARIAASGARRRSSQAWAWALCVAGAIVVLALFLATKPGRESRSPRAAIGTRRPRTGVQTSVAFRSAKEGGFRGAKGDNVTGAVSPVLKGDAGTRSGPQPRLEEPSRAASPHDRSVAAPKPPEEPPKDMAAAPAPPAEVPGPPGGPEDNELLDGDEMRPKRMGRFITALCEDLQGNLWVGTEDTGVWRYEPGADRGKRWSRFTRSNTGGPPEPDGPTLASRLPSAGEGSGVRAVSARRGSPDPAAPSYLGDDNAYALACDKLGRIWVGHLRHGVSVFNANEWRNYDVLTGPLGERVFDIATCPADGDVWIATNAGLTRYRLDSDQWSYYTRAEGLPADDVQCLAFDKQGTLFAGTQCEGLAIAKPARIRGQVEYRAWRVVAAPGAKSSEVSGACPIAPCGEGLPADLLNDVLVARDGTIYAATIAGLAASRDHGKTWQFLRGQNWEAKARGLCRPPSKEQLEAAAKLAKDRTLLAEDYVTCLAEDESGNLWVGHREKGHEVFDPRSGKRLAAEQPSRPKEGAGKGGASGKKTDAPDYVTRLLCYRGEFLAGTYGAGLAPVGRISNPPSVVGRTASPPSAPGRQDGLPIRPTTVPPLPSPAKPPTADELHDLVAQWSKPAPAPRRKSPLVIALPDDWRTQGDWLGRYGRYFACCCAICSPRDYVWGAGRVPVDYLARIGPHCTKNDSIRYWVHWLYTDNRRSLEMPPTYAHSRVVKGLTKGDKPRRQAEWDDHGESYPRTHEGPDLYCTLKIPEGLFFLSLYDFNKDGHSGNNRFRDYQVSIRAHDPKASLYEIEGFQREPELARARIHDFWGGVWKRFLVQGPAQLTIHLARNDSFNTILAGVMLDLVDEEPPPYFCTEEEWKARWAERLQNPLAGARSSAERPRPLRSPEAELVAAIRGGVRRLENVQAHRAAQWAVLSRPSYACLLRAARDTSRLLTQGGDSAERLVAPDLAATCEYHSGLFSDWESDGFTGARTTARSIEKSLRWDGGSYACQRRGFEIVCQFLEDRLPLPLLPLSQEDR